MKLIGIDIGGTKCAVCFGETDGKGGVNMQRAAAPRKTEGVKPEEMLDLLAEDVRELVSGERERPAAVGISCGSPMDSKRGIVLSPPNLPGWDHVEITAFFEKNFGIPAYLCNDANAGALAEWRMGAGRGFRNIIFMTFGTGLGAGLILNGALYEGASDCAGEIGHIRLKESGPVGFGKEGSFEGFCSGGGIRQLAEIFVKEELKNGGHPSFCPAYEDLGNLSAEKVGNAARAGDPLAVRIMSESGEKLGEGLSVLIDVLNPERIIIGSIFTRCYDELWPAAEKIIRKETLPGARNACRVVPSSLTENVGNIAALVTAAYRMGQ
jgi:glucokinase